VGAVERLNALFNDAALGGADEGDQFPDLGQRRHPGADSAFWFVSGHGLGRTSARILPFGLYQGTALAGTLARILPFGLYQGTALAVP